MAQIPALQTLRVLSAAATANMQKSPAKAIAFFVKASRLPREPNDGYDAPSEIAQKAAVIAIDFSRHESANCELIKLAFENYFSVAKGRIDQQIQYSYSFVLSNCGNSSEAQKLLEKIASASDSKFSRSAKDDLARIAISKSQELFEAGKFCQAAKVLISADVNVSQCRGLAINLLSRYVDRIDENADSNFVEVFDELGRKAVECSDRQNRTYATTLYAQAAVFNAQGRKEKLANIEKLLNASDKSSAENLDVLIARARLSGAQGNYEEAAKQWAAICEILKLEPNEPPQHSYHWWQAKYFELENSIKMPNAARVDVIHSIEVLQSSFKELPPFWDKKLKALRGAN
jgi:tetratricopeptide (TPR) repeat protein